MERAATILLFWGVDGEPRTRDLLEPLLNGYHSICLPRCLPDRGMEARRFLGLEHLLPGGYGIPEPDDACPVVPRDKLDLILVPNLCCDGDCFRLGHGGGYYDRYLAGFPGRTVALCRDGLLVPRVPTDEFDLPVELVLTETRCLSGSGAERSGAHRPASK